MQLTSLTFISGSSEMKATMIMRKHHSRISIILSSVNAYNTHAVTLKTIILGHIDSDISPNMLFNFWHFSPHINNTARFICNSYNAITSATSETILLFHNVIPNTSLIFLAVIFHTLLSNIQHHKYKIYTSFTLQN